MVSPLAQIFSCEHAPGPAQDGVLGGIIGVLLGWDLKNGWNGALVGVKCMPHHLCNVLVDEDDANVVPVQKLPVGRDEKEVQGSPLRADGFGCRGKWASPRKHRRQG